MPNLYRAQNLTKIYWHPRMLIGSYYLQNHHYINIFQTLTRFNFKKARKFFHPTKIPIFSKSKILQQIPIKLAILAKFSLKVQNSPALTGMLTVVCKVNIGLRSVSSRESTWDCEQRSNTWKHTQLLGGCIFQAEKLAFSLFPLNLEVIAKLRRPLLGKTESSKTLTKLQ